LENKPDEMRPTTTLSDTQKLFATEVKPNLNAWLFTNTPKPLTPYKSNIVLPLLGALKELTALKLAAL
jgi:hypothetical protein